MLTLSRYLVPHYPIQSVPTPSSFNISVIPQNSDPNFLIPNTYHDISVPKQCSFLSSALPHVTTKSTRDPSITSFPGAFFDDSERRLILGFAIYE
jgi:hypothetical protein